MFDFPRTLEQAKTIFYGMNWGRSKYQEGRCAHDVWNGPRGMTSSQCSRRNGHGMGKLYCKQHGSKLIPYFEEKTDD